MAFNFTFRKVFLYIFATIGLVMSIIGGVQLIDLGLKSYVFTKADNYCYDNYPAMVKDPNQPNLTQEEIDTQNRVNKERCEEQRVADKQRQASNAIAMLIVGLPLYIYNWRVIKRDKEI